MSVQFSLHSGFLFVIHDIFVILPEVGLDCQVIPPPYPSSVLLRVLFAVSVEWIGYFLTKEEVENFRKRTERAT